MWNTVNVFCLLLRYFSVQHRGGLSNWPTLPIPAFDPGVFMCWVGPLHMSTTEYPNPPVINPMHTSVSVFFFFFACPPPMALILCLTSNRCYWVSFFSFLTGAGSVLPRNIVKSLSHVFENDPLGAWRVLLQMIVTIPGALWGAGNSAWSVPMIDPCSKWP